MHPSYYDLLTFMHPLAMDSITFCKQITNFAHEDLPVSLLNDLALLRSVRCLFGRVSSETSIAVHFCGVLLRAGYCCKIGQKVENSRPRKG